jgi:3-oxoadipate CoA-transferase alpha subunit
MVEKLYPSAAAAVADIPDGATVMIGGFVAAGSPDSLILALVAHNARNLTIIANNCGFGDLVDRLAESGQMIKLIASFPVRASAANPTHFERGHRAGRIALELVPQGTLAERIRAGGCGIAAFYTPTGAGTIIAEGKEIREFDGRPHLLETALKADFALIRARRADRFGNLVYRGASRNFNPLMAMAARITIAEVDEIVKVGELDPDHIHTPGIFVDRLVRREFTRDVPPRP